MEKLGGLLKNGKDTVNNTSDSLPDSDDFPDPPIVKNEWESLSKRHMRYRKNVRFNTRKRAQAVNALEQTIYKHYYMKLTKLTKMRESLDWPSYTKRSTARSNGICLEADKSYKRRFRDLLFKVVAAWIPRDFIQRIIGIEKMHSLCIDIIYYISMCTSPRTDIFANMEVIDNFFRILRRFKISSPVFRLKRIYQGGGPKKCLKNDNQISGQSSKQDTVGEGELPVKVVNTLSAILRGQFNLEYGLVNVRKLHRASMMTRPISQKLKGYNLQPVPVGLSTVQIHYCDNHYVTSEQTESGIVVWDSVPTTANFKRDLYPQLQLTYDILSQHNTHPEGLITYKTDISNMQKDSTSCGIFAVMRAFFILSDTSSKINTAIARSYLSSALDKYEFTDYDLFTSQQRTVRMQVVMENYMAKQKELLGNKVKKILSGPTGSRSPAVKEDTIKKRGRPQKRKYIEAEKTTNSECDITATPIRKRTKTAHSPGDTIHTMSCDVFTPSRKRGRPQKLSLEERKQRQKESKLRYKWKGISRKMPIKMGRPKKYSQTEKILKDREKRLRYYHESIKEETKLSIHKQGDTRKEKLQLLRSNLTYKEQELKKYRQRNENRRQIPAYREKERHYVKEKRENPIFRDEEKVKDKMSHRDKRENPIFRHEEKAKDRKSHKEKRENPDFRNEEKAKDRMSHRDKRENTDFRDKEKAKDRKSHRNKRKNPGFRDEEKAKDRKLHRDKRENPVIREQERQWVKDKRENPEFRDEERVRDREKHQTNRADPIRRANENVKAYKRKYGHNEQDAIRKYLSAIQTGPSVVCTCCLQLWFPDNCNPLESLTFPNPERITQCKTGTLFNGREWLCSTCTRHLKEDRIPPISYANGMRFYDIPEELKLVQMEERCVALRQPFFQIRELPNGGQRSIKGNVVNVPMDVSKTINALPRDLSETETIGIKFKKKVSYKKCDYSENIRPQAVIKAAKYLIANSELYQAYNVKINEVWQEKIDDTDDSLKTLMGFQDRDNTDSDIVEIDLTMSDDDVPSMHSSSYDNLDGTNIPTKCEKIDGETTSHQAESLFNKTAMIGSPGSIGKHSSDDQENDSDEFSEVDEMENYSGNMDTMLDSPVILPAKATNIVEETSSNATDNLGNASSSNAANNVITDADALVIAPGEGQHPISLFSDPDAEYLAFPSIYCGHRRPIDTEYKTKKKPSKADTFKWECRAQDRRAATCIPDLFFKYKCLQVDAVENVVGISMRKVKGKKQPTAGELRTPEGRDKLVNLNEGYSLFSRMRNTPPYYGHKKKNLLAVVRQEGMPSLFFTQSCADTKWPGLLKVLGKLIDNKDYTDEEVEDMSPINRNRLVAADPITVVRYFENKCHKFQQHIMNLRGSSRRFLRREFQNRGSPHSHEIHWIAGAPVYDPNKPENDKNVIEFIDTWISTKIEVSPEEEKYLKYQIHKHSNSCRKRGEAICRFGIPFFPMKSTCILRPLECDEVDQQRMESLQNAYQELRKKLNDMKEGSELTHDEFLESIQMSEMDYILTIRSSLKTAKVFYQRKPNALRVNPYMKGMLAVIKANHDVQYPLDIYALVCYVADYLLKSQKGLSATLEQAVRDAMDGDMKLKQQIRHVGYNLIGAIETSAPEAAYYIMQIPFTYCSVEVVFIPTCPPEDRFRTC